MGILNEDYPDGEYEYEGAMSYRECNSPDFDHYEEFRNRVPLHKKPWSGEIAEMIKAVKKETLKHILEESKKYGSTKQWEFVISLQNQTGVKYTGTCYKDLSNYISTHKKKSEREECYLNYNEWRVN